MKNRKISHIKWKIRNFAINNPMITAIVFISIPILLFNLIVTIIYNLLR